MIIGLARVKSCQGTAGSLIRKIRCRAACSPVGMGVRHSLLVVFLFPGASGRDRRGTCPARRARVLATAQQACARGKGAARRIRPATGREHGRGTKRRRTTPSRARRTAAAATQSADIVQTDRVLLRRRHHGTARELTCVTATLAGATAATASATVGIVGSALSLLLAFLLSSLIWLTLVMPYELEEQE